MGLGQTFLPQVRLGQFFVARMEPGQTFLVWVWKISPKIPSGLKSLFGSGQTVPAGQRWVSLFFIADQKCAWVRSGPISNK